MIMEKRKTRDNKCIFSLTNSTKNIDQTLIFQVKSIHMHKKESPSIAHHFPPPIENINHNTYTRYENGQEGQKFQTKSFSTRDSSD
jgi:hypothetical protein